MPEAILQMTGDGLFQSDDIAALDRLVENFTPGMPVKDEDGKQVGTVKKIWRDGNTVRGDIEFSEPIENFQQPRVTDAMLNAIKERDKRFRSRLLQPVHSRGTVGRNDPCPCGSGKKAKRCCRARKTSCPS